MIDLLSALMILLAQERTQAFDRDPEWDGRNNRRPAPDTREIRQDFGYFPSGRVGGFIVPAAEPAYYAKAIPERTLKDAFQASGTMLARPGGGNTLVGFFNADTLNEWRTPNTLALRINGRGDDFHVHVEYATARWRAGADLYTSADESGRKRHKPWAGNKPYAWSLAYDPSGEGTVTATFGGETLVLKLDPGHKADGGTFNRFGFLNVMKSADSGGLLFLEDLTLDGKHDTFDHDPGWKFRDNCRVYRTANIRPQFDFGFSPTAHAGGRPGEIGGLVFRGDERFPERMAYYGDRLEPLSLDAPLKAAGKVALRRGVTDSTVLLGFFHSTESLRISQAQSSGIPENFLGIAIEGPSREGFLFYPIYSSDREGQGAHGAQDAKAPHILPDGKGHEWTLDYSPEGGGRITVTLDGRAVGLDLSAAHRSIGAKFDRFGLVTTHIDGNGQDVYFDDLTYTWKQPAGAATLVGHEGSILSLAFSPDGKLLASGSRDDLVRLWDVESRKVVRTLPAHQADVYSVRFSPDGRWLATGGADKTVRIWDTAGFKPVETLQGHGDAVRCAVFSQDGKMLCSSSVDQTIRLWDVATWKETRVLTGHTGQVRFVGFSPDGQTVASGATDGTVRLWDVKTGAQKTLLEGHRTSVECLAWAADGSALVSGSNDADVLVWDPATGRRRGVLKGHALEIDSLAFFPDGARLATGSKDKTVKFWDVKAGTLLGSFEAHGDRVESLAFSPDGKVLATGGGGKDFTLKLWDLRTLAK